jgi:peptidyl-dipeptidase A
MCVKRTEEDFRTVHHELGHIYYYLTYAEQPFLFQEGANRGFHEAIGDTIVLSITPGYMKAIGLTNEEPTAESDLRYLIHIALEKVPQLAMAIVVDTWRWKVYSGDISPDHYNEGWWQQVHKYQGLTAPAVRTEKDFDAGMFYHISYNVPFDRYFIATFLQFDFHRALCRAAGFQGDLHRCSIYGSRIAGQQLRDTLELGASVPWPTALEKLTGHREIDASAMLDYFAPVMAWLKKQNEGRQCGWEE